jgi:hypothetical protein
MRSVGTVKHLLEQSAVPEFEDAKDGPRRDGHREQEEDHLASPYTASSLVCFGRCERICRSHTLRGSSREPAVPLVLSRLIHAPPHHGPL